MKKFKAYLICLQAIILILSCVPPIEASESNMSWQDAYRIVAKSALSESPLASFYLFNLDGDEIPELIVDYGKNTGEEKLYFWSDNKLKAWPYEYNGLHFIPGSEKIRVTTRDGNQYTDSFYRLVNGQFILLGVGYYTLNEKKPDWDSNGSIVLNDKFSYSWMNQDMDASVYLSAVQSVYDMTQDETPYKYNLDLDGLYAAIDGGSDASDDAEPIQEAVKNEPDPEPEPTPEPTPALRYYPLNFISSDVSDYPDVKLYFSLEDDYGDPIILNSLDGTVTERLAGGKDIERTVRRIERLEGNQGLSIDIVADKSGSMDGELPKMQNIMSDFVRSLDYDTGDQVEILSFDSYVMYMCTYTRDVSLLLNGISNMVADGETALYDALATAIDNAGGRTGARCIIGFTDGEDNRSIYTPEEIIRKSKDKDVPIYLIGTGGANHGILSYIADSTGGYYWNVANITDISPILSTIYRNQKDTYCVRYRSDGDYDPYGWRVVNCSITDGNTVGEIEKLKFQATPSIQTSPHKSRYELIKADISWQDANAACIAKGGHLATLTSRAEMDKIAEMCLKKGIKYCWIGGYTSIRNGNAFGHWITGEPFQFTAWYPGEPSRNDLDGTAEFYLMLWNVEGEWSWNDQRNDVVADYDYFKGIIGYVCEYED